MWAIMLLVIALGGALYILVSIISFAVAVS